MRHYYNFLSLCFMFLCIILPNATPLQATLPKDGMNQWQLLNTAEQCEFGTIITQEDIPYTITQPGIYTLFEDVSTSANTPAITINSSNVTLNLNNHAITATSNRAIDCFGFSDIQIFNGYLTSIFGVTIHLQECDQVLIWDINVTECPDVAVLIRTCTNIIIDNCNVNFSNGHFAPGVDSEGIFYVSNDSEDVLIQNCEAQAIAFSDGYLGLGTSVFIDNCSAVGPISSNSVSGFRIDTDDASVQNCYAAKVGDGFTMEGHNNIVKNCTAEDCTRTGLNIAGVVRRAIVKDCTSSRCDVGIGLTGSNCIVSDCLCNDVNQGVLVIGASNHQIINCKVTNSASYGFLFIFATNISVQNSTALQCATNGFEFALSSATCYLKNCVATHCATGFGGNAGALGGIVIKDSLASLNTGSGISGNNLFIIDTRSGTPFNGAADAGAGSTVITY